MIMQTQEATELYDQGDLQGRTGVSRMLLGTGGPFHRMCNVTFGEEIRQGICGSHRFPPLCQLEFRLPALPRMKALPVDPFYSLSWFLHAFVSHSIRRDLEGMGHPGPG